MKRDTGIKSAERLLDIVELLNKRRGATVAELASDADISRKSVYRILSTLQKYGYVKRLEADRKFYLTHLVRKLSDGFSEEEWIRDLASPILEHLSQEIVWPADLATFINDAMYIRDTSRRLSPFSVDWVTVGHRLPMMISAAGRSYLTHCPEVEREEIILTLRKSSDQFDRLVRKRGYVDGFIEKTLEDGYASRCDTYIYDQSTSSIAIPVRNGERVLGVMGIVFIASVTTPEEIAERHLDALVQSRDDLERRLSEITV